MTKKARFIKQLKTISDEEKEAVIAFFNSYPVYENCIDWNNKSLTSMDFMNVFEKAWNSKKNIKKKKKLDPEELFKNKNIRIVGKTEEFWIIIPLDWECAVFLNSFECGGTEAKWCIGRKRTHRFWNNYLKTGSVFYFIYFIKKSYMWGKKIIIQYKWKNDSFYTWLGDNRCIDSLAPMFEEICRNDLSSFSESNSLHKKYITKYSIKLLFSKFKPENKYYSFLLIIPVFSLIIKMITPAIVFPIFIFAIIQWSLFVVFLMPLVLRLEELKRQKNEIKKRTKETINRIKSANLLDDFEFELDDTEKSESVKITGFIGKTENLIIPEAVDNIQVTTIGSFAFQSGGQIEKITLPENLISIESYAFIGCEKLTSIKLPKMVRNIESSAFFCCENLEKIVVDDENPYYTSHEGILFDKKMTTIIKYPSQNMRDKYIIPETVNIIGDDAFNGCKKLTKIIIHKNILIPERTLFSGCDRLAEIFVNEENLMYKSIDGVLFYKNENELLRYPQGKENTDYIVPQKTTRINSFAFSNCIYLKNIIFPESLEIIGDYAFNFCENLVSLTFPQNLKYIGKEVFDDSPKLETVRLSRKTKKEKNTFKGFKGKIVYLD